MCVTKKFIVICNPFELLEDKNYWFVRFSKLCILNICKLIFKWVEVVGFLDGVEGRKVVVWLVIVGGIFFGDWGVSVSRVC